MPASVTFPVPAARFSVSVAALVPSIVDENEIVPAPAPVFTVVAAASVAAAVTVKFWFVVWNVPLSVIGSV